MIRATLLCMVLLACNAKPASAPTTMDPCRQAKDSLAALLKTYTLPDFSDSALGEAEYYFHPFDRRVLHRQGLHKPDSLLLASLRQHPELIPDTAVLGGTLYVEWVKPIGTSWALAQYSDGHVQGRAVYAYKRVKNGEIKWQLLDGRLD